MRNGLRLTLCAWAVGLSVLGARVAESAWQTSTASDANATMAAMTSSSSGVFSDEQATRGEETYMSLCVSCHPRGTYSTAAFRTAWNGRPLSELFDLVKDKMPKNDPGSLTPGEYIQVVAYLLKINGAASGKAELLPDRDALKKIRLDMPSGNGPGH